MKLFLQYLVAVIVVAVTVRQMVGLARNPRDRGLRVMNLGFLALSYAKLQITDQPIFVLLDRLLGRPLHITLINAGWVASAYCFAIFFSTIKEGHPVARQARAAAASHLAIAIVLSYLILLPLIHTAGGRDYRSWEQISYVLATDGVAAVLFMIGIIRAYKYIPSLQNHWLRWSIRVLCLGAAGMIVVDVVSVVKLAVRIVQDVDYPKRWPLLSDAYIVGLLGGQAALALGLVLPAIGAGVEIIRRQYDRARARRLSAEIEPLWSLLTRAFPYVVLPEYKAPGHPSTAAAYPRKALSRQVAEVSDALAQLSPHFRAAGLRAGASTQGVDDPAEAAQIVVAALRLHAGDSGRAEPPYPRLEPDYVSWQARASWMARTARHVQRNQASAEHALPGRV